MPGKAREARPLPRMVRMMISRNGLRRPADRVESAVVVTLLAAFVAAVAAAAFIGARIYQSQSASAARLRPSVAVLTSSGPGTSLSGYGQAQARWREPDGDQRSGILTTGTAPAIWDAAAGARVPVWLDRTGEPATPPAGRTAMILTALLVPLWGAGGTAIVLVICYWLCRLALDRRRLAAWESAWARTGPRWTSRR